MTNLRVSLDEEHRDVSPTTFFAFGREGDLVIDTNRYLHRRLGVFRFHDGTWSIANVGSTIVLEIVDRESPSRTTLAPGSTIPLPFSLCWIRFQAGAASYEIQVEADVRAAPVDAEESHHQATTTITATRVTLNDEQRLLLIALAERRIRTGSVQADLPTNREVADRLRWALTKYNRKLDNLCTKFDRLGVPGIKGDLAGMAVGRRKRLVDHVVNSGIVDESDLVLLEML